MVIDTRINRRQFVLGTAAVGGAMVLSSTALAGRGLSSASAQSGGTTSTLPEGVVELTPRLRINPDDSITVYVTKPEAGQGTSTTMVVFVCEELGSDPLDTEMVHLEWADPQIDAAAGENMPFQGQMDAFHTWFYGRADYVRTVYQQVGASARERLKLAGAEQLGVDASELRVENNQVIHDATGESIGFGALAAAAAAITLDEEPAIHEPHEWVLIGKPHRKRETPAKVSGETIYGIDVTLPDMLIGAVAQTPILGGSLKSFDIETAMEMPGVEMVVPMAEFSPSSIVVLADTYWHARKAIEAMSLEWEGGAADLNIEDIHAWHEEALEQPGILAEDVGDALSVLESADQVFEAVYQTPYRMHAPMEPRNATALFDGDELHIWNGGASHDSAASLANRVTQIPLDKIRTHAAYVGGAYGPGRGTTDAGLAALVAMQMPGRPVKLIWTREDHSRTGMFDPFGMAKLQMSVDEEGWPSAFFVRKANQKWYFPPPRGPEEADSTGLRWILTDTNLANPTIHAPDITPEKREELLGIYYDGLAYRVPNHRVEYHDIRTPLPVSAMRSPGLSSNVFMVESFIDEVAHAVGKDPLEMRYWLLREVNEREPGWHKVLDVVAEKAPWGKTLPKGSGQGIAVCAEHGTIIAAIAEVTVTPEGKLTVDQVDVAFDAGYILNPDGARNQLEGSTLFGWSMALNEEITVQNGQVVEANFDKYQIARNIDAPRVFNVHFDATSDYRPDAALGEATIPHMAAAVGNAIFAATGKRIRSLPFRKHDLSWS